MLFIKKKLHIIRRWTEKRKCENIGRLKGRRVKSLNVKYSVFLFPNVYTVCKNTNRTLVKSIVGARV